jgi:hypothetical protein
MDEASVDRRTFLKLAGAGVAASALAVALPGSAFGAPAAAEDTQRFLLRGARGHVHPDVLRHVARAIGS